MNRGRLISHGLFAVVTVALVVVGIAPGLADDGDKHASAETSKSLSLPPGWIPLPRLLDSSSQAPTSRFELQATGDPASGCFLLTSIGTLSGSFDRNAYDRGLERILARAGVAVQIRDQGATFSEGELQGTIRTVASSKSGKAEKAEKESTVETRACFYNQRQPSECQRLCESTVTMAGTSR